MRISADSHDKDQPTPTRPTLQRSSAPFNLSRDQFPTCEQAGAIVQQQQQEMPAQRA